MKTLTIMNPDIVYATITDKGEVTDLRIIGGYMVHIGGRSRSKPRRKGKVRR